MTAARHHGTRARYCSGPTGSDSANGCRCEPCRDANRVYSRFDAKRRRLARQQGRWASPNVAIDKAKAHIETLRRSGVGTRQIARLAGISRTQVGDIAAGRTHYIRRVTEAAILAVDAQLAPGALIDAGPTWELVERLVAFGITRKRIGQAITGRGETLSLQLHRDRVTVGAARCVEALHWEILGDPAQPDRPDTRLFPVGPLVCIAEHRGLSRTALCARAGITLRALSTGLTSEQADRAAIALGLHPAELWEDFIAFEPQGCERVG